MLPWLVRWFAGSRVDKCGSACSRSCCGWGGWVLIPSAAPTFSRLRGTSATAATRELDMATGEASRSRSPPLSPAAWRRIRDQPVPATADRDPNAPATAARPSQLELKTTGGPVTRIAVRRAIPGGDAATTGVRIRQCARKSRRRSVPPPDLERGAQDRAVRCARHDPRGFPPWRSRASIGRASGAYEHDSGPTITSLADTVRGPTMWRPEMRVPGADLVVWDTIDPRPTITGQPGPRFHARATRSESRYPHPLWLPATPVAPLPIMQSGRSRSLRGMTAAVAAVGIERCGRPITLPCRA